MRILFYDTKKYDRDSFEKVTEKYPEIEIEYTDTDINSKTANLAKGYKAICAFVSSDVGKETIDCLSKNGVELVLLRCAGFNNVDLEEAKKKNNINYITTLFSIKLPFKYDIAFSNVVILIDSKASLVKNP